MAAASLSAPSSAAYAAVRSPRGARSPARGRDGANDGSKGSRSPARSRERVLDLDGDVEQLAQWRRQRTQTLRYKLEKALSELKTEKNRCSELRKSLVSTEERKAEFEARYTEMTQIAEERCSREKEDSERIKAERAFTDGFLKRQAEVKAERQRQEDALQQNQRAAVVHYAQMNAYLANWKEHAGMEIQRVGKALHFIFTFNDSANEWEGSFNLGTDATKEQYFVTCITPELPPVPVKALVDKINAASKERWAFPAFVCGMRGLFLQHQRIRSIAAPLRRRRAEEDEFHSPDTSLKGFAF